MKQCPKCNFTCTDEDIICKSCGYLFTPEGFGSDEPSQSNLNNLNGVPPQGDFNNPNGVPPQNGSNNPNGAPPQGDFNNSNGVPPQGDLNNPNGMPPQNGSNNPYGAPPQGDLNNPNGMPPQDGSNNPYGVPPQGDPNQWQSPSYNTQGTNFQVPPTNGLSIASLVLGIIGVVFACCYAIGIIPSIISLVLGIISMKKIKSSQGTQKGSGMSLAGIILASVGILLSIYMIVSLILHGGEIANIMQNYMNNYHQYSSYGSSSSPF